MQESHSVKKRFTEKVESGRNARSAEFPNFKTSPSTLDGGSPARSFVSPEAKRHPRNGTVKVDAASGKSKVSDVDMTNSSAVTEATNIPYNLPKHPLKSKTQATGTDLLLKSLIRRRNSPREISFLLIAQDIGIPAAVSFAKQLGLEYKNSLAELRRAGVIDSAHDANAQGQTAQGIQGPG